VIDSLRRDVLGGMQEGDVDKAMAEEREKSVELAKARIVEFESAQNKRLARYGGIQAPPKAGNVG